MAPKIADLRRDYALASLSQTSVDADPMAQFQHWLEQALQAEVLEPTAMTLATIDARGRPCARIVLLKGLSAAGFAFFTNYHSAKGEQLATQPHAALVFFWQELERQVRIEGCVETVSAAESDDYFANRPRGSQVGAAASRQSQVVASRQVLETRFEQLQSQWQDRAIPRPSHWGGYQLVPDCIEFWQGRRSRLHDRLRYRRVDNNATADSIDRDQEWLIERLEP